MLATANQRRSPIDDNWPEYDPGVRRRTIEPPRGVMNRRALDAIARSGPAEIWRAESRARVEGARALTARQQQPTASGRRTITNDGLN